MRKHHYVIAAGLTAALVATGGPASAETKSKKDKTGDAAPVVDITRWTVHNKAKTLSIHVKLAKSKAGRVDVTGTITPDVEGAPTYQFATDSTAKGKATATLSTTAADSTEATPVECKGLKAAVSSGRNGQVVVMVPQSCLGEEPAESVTVTVATVTPAGETADTVPGELVVERG